MARTVLEIGWHLERGALASGDEAASSLSQAGNVGTAFSSISSAAVDPYTDAITAISKPEARPTR
jgi:hypothetical protein